MTTVRHYQSCSEDSWKRTSEEKNPDSRACANFGKNGTLWKSV